MDYKPIKPRSEKKAHTGHRARLRKRFLIAPETLPDYELLELLLGYVLLRKDTKLLAKDLLQAFGSIKGVLDARSEELSTVCGVGPGIETFILLLREILARHAEGPARQKIELCTPESVAHMAKMRLGRTSHEEVWCAFLDNGNALLAWEKLATGSVSSSTIFPRDILETALSFKATSFILVHNHPGGSLKPSAADLQLTQKIKEAAKSLGIRFLDHIIVTSDASYSLNSEGLL